MTTTNNAPISFRLTDDELELLRQYQEDGEKSLNLTAKRLLLSALGVEVKKPSLQIVNSVDMIQVQELIETAVQEKLEKLTIVDNVDIIKNLIAESLADGEIKEAIASAYEAAMGQFNGLLEELQELKKQVEEFKSSPATVPSPQSPITNDQLPGEDVDSDRTPNTLTQSPMTDDQLIEALGIVEIIAGNPYDAESLGDIPEKIEQHKLELQRLGVKISPAPLTTLNSLLKCLGYAPRRTNMKGKKVYVVGES
jgi:hypothetical protein